MLKEMIYVLDMSWKITNLWLHIYLPVASFTKEVDLRLAKRTLKTNGRLANLELTSLVKEATWDNELTQFYSRRPQASSALFFQYNEQLGPPYHVIVDTNFINFSIKNKLDIVQSMMDCLYAKCKLSGCWFGSIWYRWLSARLQYLQC